MPRRDNTGPFEAGRGDGLARKTGKLAGRGRMGGPEKAGPEGFCKCPNCGEKVKHMRAEPCANMKCPKCGTTMARD